MHGFMQIWGGRAMYPDAMNPKSSTNVTFASSPEGLVSLGDVSAMQRFLLLSGDQAGQDLARESLLQAATNNLAITADKQVVRMRLYGWPVSVSYSQGVQVPSTLGFGSKAQPQVSLKMRELWSRAFGATPGVLICPLISATHIDSLLAGNPIVLRDCIRHGVATLSGKAGAAHWSFDSDGPKMRQASPELPAVFMFGAYVCWDVNAPEPSVAMPPDVLLEMQQLAGALFASGPSAVASVQVGSPVVFHEAITQGQGLQFAGMVRRSAAINRSLGMSNRVDGNCISLTAMYIDPVNGEDDPDLSIDFSYSNLWRPSTHLSAIVEIVEQEARAIEQRAQARESRTAKRAFGDVSKFH